MPGSLRLRSNQNVIREAPFSRGNRSDFSGISTEDESEGTHTPWFVTLTLPSVLGLSSAWVATIFVGFLLGISLGRHQGVQSALEDYGQEAVRIPLPSTLKKEVPHPVAEAEKEKNPLAVTESLFTPSASVPMSQAPVVTQEAHPEAELLVESLPVKPNKPEKLDKPEKPVVEAPAARWIVQAATFRNRSLASVAEKKIRSLKIPVLVDEGQREGTKYYRIVLGPFASSEKATVAKKQVVRAKIVKGELYTKQLAPH